MKRKTIVFVLVAALVLAVGTLSVFAAADDPVQRGVNYTDADGDGVCDNRDSGALCPQDGTGAQNGHRNGRTK